MQELGRVLGIHQLKLDLLVWLRPGHLSMWWCVAIVAVNGGPVQLN
jgi:hypothetical protein